MTYKPFFALWEEDVDADQDGDSALWVLYGFLGELSFPCLHRKFIRMKRL